LRTAVFIDGANVFYQLEDARVRFDFKSLIEEKLVSKNDELVAVHYFNSSAGGEELKKFFHVLKMQDIQVHILDAVLQDGVFRQKGVDVLLAVTAVASMDSYDKIIIVSGDADFLPLGEYLKTSGKNVFFAGFKRTFGQLFKSFKKIYLDGAVEELEADGKAWRSSND